MKNRIRTLALCAGLTLLGLTSGEARAAQVERAYTPVTRYDLKGQATGTIAPDPDGSGPLRYLAMRNSYNALGQLAKTESGELSAWLDETVAPRDWGGAATFQVFLSTEYSYDDYGRKVTELVRGANGAAESLVQYSYVSSYLVGCKALRMNPAVFATPPASACSLGPEGPNGPDRITRYTYDALDQVLTEQRAVGVVGLQQTYSTSTYSHRLLTSQTDANGNRTELRYDGYGRIRQRLFPSPTARNTANAADFTEFAYDRNGNVVSERKRDGRTISTAFDANDRPIRKDLSDNTYSADVYYDYDLRGLLLHARFGSDAGQGETLSYDAFGGVRTRATDLGGTGRQLRFAYDANANRVRVTHSDGYFFSYGFDALNRAIGVASSDAAGESSPSSTLLGVAYGRDGARSGIARPGGVSTSYSRDNAARLERFSQTFATGTDSLTNSFAYNPANQVVRLSQSNDQYNFREVANRTGVYVANGLNQYTAIGGQGIQYDRNGNLIEDGGVHYTYDMENRLVAASGQVDGADVDARLTWDTSGRLHELTVNGVATQFQYDGDALVAEYAGSALMRRYVHGDQVDEPWVQYNGAGTAEAERRYLLADHQGSVIAHADSAGRPLSKLAYDNYGIPAAANMDRFGYTGQAWIKQLGLYHYKARMYHPKLGRFLQTDPIGYRDDFNLYAYVGGDPMNRTDPTGKCPWCIGAIIGAAIDVATQITINLASGQDLGDAITNIDAKSVLVSAAMGAAGNIGGGKALVTAARSLSNQTKGKIGETITRVGIAARGETVVARGSRARDVAELGRVTGRARNARPDFAVRKPDGTVQAVEAKFGTAHLTGAQTELRTQLGDDAFRLSTTSYAEVQSVGGVAGSIVGGVAGGCSAGITQSCNR